MWKHPTEDFYNNSVLIVSESENAMFYNQGIIEKIYSAGKYDLTTSCFPISETILKKFTAGKSPFHCKLFFVNMTEKIDLKWGTSSPIQIKDPEYNFIVGIKSNGTYSLVIKEPKKFIVKLIGTNVQCLKFEEVGTLFRDYFGMKIREFLHEIISSEGISIFEIESKLSNLSEKIAQKLNLFSLEYGLEVKKFSISEITIPQDDPNYAIINSAYAKKASIGIQGENFEKATKAEALVNFSKNEGIGGVGVISAGLVLDSFSKSHNNSSYCKFCGQSILSNAKFCSCCGHEVANYIFCSKCGNKNDNESRFCSKCGNELRKE